MKVITLTQGKHAIIDDIDFDRISLIKWSALSASNKGLWYAKSHRARYMHRFILGLTDPKIQVDHRDGDGLNNTRNNLRIATTAQNGANRKKQSTKTSSKFKGVTWHKHNKKWQATIGLNGNRKQTWLGNFDNELDAAAAYDKAALNHFGEFARTNGNG